VGGVPKQDVGLLGEDIWKRRKNYSNRKGTFSMPKVDGRGNKKRANWFQVPSWDSDNLPLPAWKENKRENQVT